MEKSILRGVKAHMSTTDRNILGMRNQYGRDEPFGLSLSDRVHHLYCVGKSGTGKTTLMENIAAQALESGGGLALLDPHGDSSVRFLEYIPRSRIEDVVYFDPSDTEFPVSFNVFANVPPERRHLVASGIVGAFKGIWADSWGPRLEYILYATVAALLECQDVSMLAIPRMLTDAGFRSWVLRQVKDPAVLAVWEKEIAAYDRRFFNEAIAPIQNKVGQLLMSPLLRNILGQSRNRIDARHVMDNGKILIANLSKGKLGEDKTNLLGAFIVSLFQVAALSRADQPECERRPFMLLVDEFQSFASSSFASMLSEARKFNLSLALFHQHSEQIRPETYSAIVGNVGTIVSFRVGHRDAQALEQAFGMRYPAHHFTGLNNYEVCVKLLNNGQDLEPFTGYTLPLKSTNHGHGPVVIMRSRLKYARPRAHVERGLQTWFKKRKR